MTDQQILETINSVRPNIKKLARVFIRKMRQPSIYSFQDLEQEAEKAILYHIRKGSYDVERGKQSTFLILSVLSTYITLMHKSYRLNPIEEKKKEVFNSLRTRYSEKFKLEELSIVSYVMEEFTEEERSYLVVMINPPEEVKIGMARNRKSVRRLVRENLNISLNEEKRIRESIKRKLESVG